MSERAIRKLRIKFILSATLAYMTAMMLMGAIIYGTNVIVTSRQINGILDYIINHEGDLPSPSSADVEEEGGKEGGEGNENEDNEIVANENEDNEVAASEKESTEADGREGEGNEKEKEDESESSTLPVNTISMGDIFTTNPQMYNTPEFLYSTRFFAVIFDSEDEVEEVKISHISSVDEDSAKLLAQGVLHHHPRFGIRGLYFYKKADLENDRTIVVFLDSRNQVATNTRLLYTSLIVLGFGLIIVMIIVRALSYRNIQPEIENARRQEQFITNASHELKTPLAVIRANTEVEQMLHGEDEWNRSTLAQIDRMTGLIQNLVLISRARENQDRSHAILIDASRAVKETADTFQPVAAQQGKTLTTQIGEKITLLGEDGDLRQLSSLLIDNAIKYCDEKGTIRVVLTQKNRGMLRLEVYNDYAEGAHVDYKRFFERFYRQDESHNIGQGGYGIGLSIAESLVQKYRGTIDVSWKDGAICFTCLLRG